MPEKNMDTESISEISVTEKDVSVVSEKHVVNHNRSHIGPFEVYLKSKQANKNIGNLHTSSLAELVLYLKNNNIIRANRKGRNRIGILFKNADTANEFVNHFQNNSDYNAFIPYN